MKNEPCNAEERYITSAFGLVVDMPLVEKNGFSLRIPTCDLPFYISEGYRLVPKSEQSTIVNKTS